LKAKTQKYLLITIGILAIGGLMAYSFIKLKKPKTIYLLGGLDNRSGDLDINQQVDLIKQGSGVKYNVIGFRYNNVDAFIQQIQGLSQQPYIVLFSAGCRKSNEITKTLLQKKYSLKNLYIVEPYATSQTTSNSVIESVKLGVPNKNIIVGRSKSVGKGVVVDATPTPSCTPSHWCALVEVGKIILNN
jgi:hypothetical protein